jgi:NADPH2:quinone reductase
MGLSGRNERVEHFDAIQVVNEEGRAFGRRTTLTIDDLNPGDVAVRVHYSDVNFKDALAVTGKGKIMRRFPTVAGIDLAGEVVSSEDGRFNSGDHVVITGYGLGEEHDGGYARYARVSAEWIVPLPDGLSLHDAMAIGTAGFTAAMAVQRLEDNGLEPGQGPVAVPGATGGVGSIAVDILAGLGYEVTAITGKSDADDYLRNLGATNILRRQEIDLGTRPLEKGLWAGAVDPVGGELLTWLTRTTNPLGSIASCGLAGGHELHTTVMPFILRGVNLLGVNSVHWPMEKRRALWQRLTSDMRPRHLAQITRTIVFDELMDAFEPLMAGTVMGRTVVRIDETYAPASGLD